MAERHYLLNVVSEPDEKPIILTQDLLDVILDDGRAVLSRAATDASAPETSSDGTAAELVDFATVETSDGGPFLLHGRELSPDESEALFQAGCSELLAQMLEKYRKSLDKDRDEA